MNYMYYLLLGCFVSGFYFSVVSQYVITSFFDLFITIFPSVVFVFVFPFLYFIDKHKGFGDSV